jgi:hypothetical protein
VRASNFDYSPDQQENVVFGQAETRNIDFALQPISQSSSRDVVLKDGNSFDFLKGEKGQYTGGEFYVGSENGQAKLWANNTPQRGVLDLGNIGNADLQSVSIPTEGYTRFGVQAVVGHTIVALARDGEEGHFVVCRVMAINGNSEVELNCLFR